MPASLCERTRYRRRPAAGLAVEVAILPQAAPKIPPIVANAREKTRGRIPGVEEPRGRVAVQTMAGIAAPLQSQLVLRGPAVAPEPQPQRDAARPIRPDPQDERQAIDGLALLAGEDPGATLDGGRTGLGNPCVIEAKIAPFPHAPGAQGAREESWPRPVSPQHVRQAVLRHGFQRLYQGHATAGCAIREQRRERLPYEPWQRVPSFVTVGSELYSISPLLRNSC
jgi:hypothetical protein